VGLFAILLFGVGVCGTWMLGAGDDSYGGGGVERMTLSSMIIVLPARLMLIFLRCGQDRGQWNIRPRLAQLIGR